MFGVINYPPFYVDVYVFPFVSCILWDDVLIGVCGSDLLVIVSFCCFFACLLIGRELTFSFAMCIFFLRMWFCVLLVVHSFFFSVIVLYRFSCVSNCLLVDLYILSLRRDLILLRNLILLGWFLGIVWRCVLLICRWCCIVDSWGFQFLCIFVDSSCRFCCISHCFLFCQVLCSMLCIWRSIYWIGVY